ncbi:hypothetical protein ACFV46_30315 [Streptomyces sp. NPDC059852]|uniref:hypothetical protein n=1 Tax=Streptomyces sp. NPDC059852 TaxID=3346972 RepID=UPI003646AA9D
MLSLLWAVLSYLAFTVWVPGQQERYEHYRAAEPCPAQAAPQETAAKDCLTTRHLTVAKAESIHTGKVTAYEATLQDPGDASWQEAVRLSDSGQLSDKLHEGDEVIATGWRGDIVLLSKDGVRQETTDAPRDERQGNAALGVLVALLGAQSLVFGVVRLEADRLRALRLGAVRQVVDLHERRRRRERGRRVGVARHTVVDRACHRTGGGVRGDGPSRAPTARGRTVMACQVAPCRMATPSWLPKPLPTVLPSTAGASWPHAPTTEAAPIQKRQKPTASEQFRAVGFVRAAGGRSG